MEASDTSWRTSQIHSLTKGKTSVEKHNPCYIKIINNEGEEKEGDGGERDLFVLPHTQKVPLELGSPLLTIRRLGMFCNIIWTIFFVI